MTGYNVREGDGDISLAVSDIAGQNEGAYSLDVTSGKVQIKGNTYGGVISGIESLRQLLPAEIESPAVEKDINCSRLNGIKGRKDSLQPAITAYQPHQLSCHLSK